MKLHQRLSVNWRQAALRADQVKASQESRHHLLRQRGMTESFAQVIKRLLQLGLHRRALPCADVFSEQIDGLTEEAKQRWFSHEAPILLLHWPIEPEYRDAPRALLVRLTAAKRAAGIITEAWS